MDKVENSKNLNILKPVENENPEDQKVRLLKDLEEKKNTLETFINTHFQVYLD